MRFSFQLAAVASALVLIPGGVSHAADVTVTGADLQKIRDEIRELKQSYESRIAALERRLKEAEEKSRAVAGVEGATALPAQIAATPATTGTGSTGIAAFNPGISLILSGGYSNLSRDPSQYQITGFALPNSLIDDLRPQRGFSLGESELGIYANVDHLFYGGLNFAIHPDNSVSAEEAFVQTTSLPNGFTLKAGRFFSGIGYQNEQHAHTWDFVDTPLAYKVFLGGQFSNDGVQVRWLAPTDTFLEFGAETGSGANFPGTDRNRNGAGGSAIYVHAGDDVGASHSWRAGVSLLQTSPRDRQWRDIDARAMAVDNSFSGRSRLAIVDGVWKWAPQGNARNTYLNVQGEYLRLVEKGDGTYDVSGASLGPITGPYVATQSGWTLQAVYQWAPAWRAGVRTERLNAGSPGFGISALNMRRPDYAPARRAWMVDYNPSEFSRLRLEFAQDRSRQGITDNQVFLQYQMSLGAHGAHKF
jgi:hypothetical protein